MLNDIKDGYRKLKDEVYEFKGQDDNQDFVKLVQLKDIPDELKETLILLHSNYSSEIREVRFYYTKLINKVIDKDLEAVEYFKNELDKIKTVTTPAPSNGIFGFLQHLDKLQKIWITTTIIVVILFLIEFINPGSLEKVTTAFKEIFGFGLIPAEEAGPQ